MSEIGLVEVIAKVRSELAAAIATGADAEVQFPVGAVTLEFQVGVSRDINGGGEVKLWVLELNASTQYASETVQTITVTLDPPVSRTGARVLVGHSSQEKPG